MKATAVLILTAFALLQTAPIAPAMPHSMGEDSAPGESIKGTVAKTMNAAGYTYVEVDTGTEKLWAATTEIEVKVGQAVEIPPGLVMKNFESPTLKRTFDKIYFVSGIILDGQPTGADGLPPGHPSIKPSQPSASECPSPKAAAALAATTAAPVATKLDSISQPDGALSVADIIVRSKELAGKEVTVKGKVVKYNAGVLGRNWLHITDGLRNGVPTDLTVTSSDSTKLGDVVIVKGTVAVDQDFGSGYAYPVLIEKATLTAD